MKDLGWLYWFVVAAPGVLVGLVVCSMFWGSP